MKTTMKFWLIGAMAISIQTAQGQQINDERMTRDIEVAENVLTTLIKNELNKEHTFFGIEVTGNYQPGFGVTFHVPGDFYSAPMVVSSGGRVTTIWGRSAAPIIEYTEVAEEAPDRRNESEREAVTLRARSLSEEAKETADSARTEYNNRVINAARNFIVDYGDFVSQLQPNEKIIVTNRPHRIRGYRFFNGTRTHIQVEASKSDITAFRQGKMTRDQLLGKLTVVNTETVDERDKDMELLTSIFDRLYRPDLSTTFFTDGNLYYERLKDYGAILYMQVYSSRGDGMVRLMPTQGNAEVTVEERDRKVIELYPKFEKELMENILEYGRRIQSLKDNEILVLNVTLTKCQGCGIPSTLEITVNNSVLRDYDAGKIDRNAALGQMSVKKGPKQ